MTSFSSSQDLIWSHTTGDHGVTMGMHTGTDLLNNIYVGAAGPDRMYLIKYTEDGMLEFMIGDDHTDQFNGMAVDPGGKSFLVGGIPQLNSGDGVIRVYESDGTMDYEQYYDYMGEDDTFEDITIDTDGHAYVTGQAKEVNDHKALTIKYSPDGSVKWIQNYGDLQHQYHGKIIKINEENEVFTIGNVYVGASGNRELFVVRYDEEGNIIEKMQFPFAGYPDVDPRFTLLDEENNLYVGGTLGSGPTLYSGFLVKITDSNIEWTVIIASNAQYVVFNNGTFDAGGNIIICGQHKEVNIDAYYAKVSPTGTMIYEMTINGPGNGDDAFLQVMSKNEYVYLAGGTVGIGTNIDYYLLKVDANGIKKWDSRYNGFGNAQDVCYGMTLDQEDNVILTGVTSEGGNYECTSLKYSNSLGIEDANNEQLPLKLLINPVYNRLVFSYAAKSAKATFEVIDMTGKVLKKGRLENDDHHDIAIDSFLNGVYLLRIKDGNMSGNAKFIKK